MKIIKPTYEILTEISDGGIKELKHIEKIGRVCYKSEDKITEYGESAKKFVAMLINRGHEAMLEHSSLSVKFIVDRGVSHELVRHRIASFAQESTRYVSSSSKSFDIKTDDDAIYAYTVIGMSMKKIADKSHGKYSEWDIYKLLSQNNIPKRTLGSRGTINQDYFETIDTPEKAFLIGFIMADGSVRQDLSQLTISQKENESWWMLNMIRDFIQPDAKSCTIHNKKICQDLYNKGIIPNKTYESTEETMSLLWDSIPNNLKYDFLRGLLDGDGSIRWFYQTPTSATKSCHIQFAGNGYLLNKIKDFIYQDLSYESKVHDDSVSECLKRYVVTDSKIGKILCDKMYKNFQFPYGHSKTLRYYEAFNLNIPVKQDKAIKNNFNVIIPHMFTNPECGKALWIWGRAMLGAEISYTNMIEAGATPQEARTVLPNSLKTEITITANYREWRNFFKLRTAQAAHPQMREVTIPLLSELKTLIPVIFDDIEVENE